MHSARCGPFRGQQPDPDLPASYCAPRAVNGKHAGLGPPVCGATSVSCLPALSLFCGTVSEFPITTTANYHKLTGSKQMKVAQSYPTLCDPMDYTAHGILQARILEWTAFPFSRGSSQPRGRTHVSRIASGFFTLSHTGSPRILKWVAFPFSRESSQPRDRTHVSHIAGGFFTTATCKCIRVQFCRSEVSHGSH